MRRRALIAIALAVLAGPAVAQPADPIDAILHGRTVSKEIDPEEPDTAASGARTDPEPAFAAPTPSYPPPPRPTLTTPVFLQETGRSADAPPTSTELAYDNRIRASMAAARGFQGPMEGGWTLSAGSRELYVFQLIDHDGLVEGAWRDARRPGVATASGFIDAVERSGRDVTFRFAGAAATLHPAGDGRWLGELTEKGATVAVNLRRRP
jgi:hypothetical protein